MKICTKCGDEHPATTEFFSKHPHTKDKLASQCKKCCRKRKKEYNKTEIGKAHLSGVNKRYRDTINGRLHRLFGGMKQRCSGTSKNPRDKKYIKNGIKCLFKSSDELIDYVINVLKVDPRGLDCDRIDNNGHYEKGNIRFITHRENMMNR